jgi:hypothetical protein
MKGRDTEQGDEGEGRDGRATGWEKERGDGDAQRDAQREGSAATGMRGGVDAQ